MNRKQFLGAFLCAGAGAGRLQAGDRAEETGVAPPLTPCEEKVDFAHGWITRFMESLDAEVPPPDRIALLEARGRSCARGGAVAAAKQCEGDVDKLVSTIAGWSGASEMRREGNRVRVAFTRCACPMVAEVKAPLSPTYCHCSVGWIKEMFETVSGGPVTVEVLETVKRGGTACRFDLRLEA
jgi:predicted hydrocarbon binding protein